MNFPFHVVLLIAGLVPLLIGLLGRIRYKGIDIGTQNPVIRVILCLVGVVLMVIAFLVYSADKRAATPDNANAANANTGPTSPSGRNNANAPPAAGSSPAPSPTPSLPKPELLLQLIVQQQQAHVRESYGKFEGQNFSDRDYAQFVLQKTDKNIAERLKTDDEFLDLVLAIKRLSAGERRQLFERGLSTYKPTWKQNGKIDATGQTDKGQQAQRLIAQAIVSLADKLSRLSEEEIEKLRA